MIVAETTYDIRFTGPDDIRVLREWLSDERMMQWYPPSTKDEALAMAKNWIGFAKYRASLTAIFEDHPVGIATLFLMPYKKVSHISMLYLIVDPKYQRKGVGSSLLKNIMHYAKKFKLESVHLEAYEGSPIIPLLMKSGFYEMFSQKNYIEFGGELKARFVFEKAVEV